VILLDLLVVRATLFKKPQGAVVSKRIGMKFGRIVLQVNTHLLFNLTPHFQDGAHNVISRRKVLPFGECTRSVCPVHMQQRLPAYLW